MWPFQQATIEMHHKFRMLSLVLAASFCITVNGQAVENTPIADEKKVDKVTSTEPDSIATSTLKVSLPARTPIRMTLLKPVSSKTSLPGEQFSLSVSEDIKINNTVVIPKGTAAIGEVIHAQKAKGFGKAGELLVTVRHIELNGIKIKMRSFQPLQGNDKTNTTLAVSQIPVAGLFAGFIQGGDIEIPSQTQVQAQTSSEITINDGEKTTIQDINSNINSTGDSK
jgi:hypothetical protein